jgi:hypothetical protein
LTIGSTGRTIALVEPVVGRFPIGGESTMTYDEWAFQVTRLVREYNEGAILSKELFNATMYKAIEVEQDNCDDTDTEEQQ